MSLPLSTCGVVLADQGSRAWCRAFQVFCWDSKSVSFLINLSWWKPIIMVHVLNYALFIPNQYPLTTTPPPPTPLWVKLGLVYFWFSSALVYTPLHHKGIFLYRIKPCFSPTMHNILFTQTEIRAISETCWRFPVFHVFVLLTVPRRCRFCWSSF